MMRKIKLLLADPGALFGGAILVGVVVFCAVMGAWIMSNFGSQLGR